MYHKFTVLSNNCRSPQHLRLFGKKKQQDKFIFKFLAVIASTSSKPPQTKQSSSLPKLKRKALEGWFNGGL